MTSRILDLYRPWLRPDEIENLLRLGEGVSGKTLLHVCSHDLGPRRLSVLRRMGRILAGFGVLSRWEALRGPGRITRAALRSNAGLIRSGADLVVIHGIEPMGLVEFRASNASWVWRCHGDPSSTRDIPDSWIRSYDAAIYSHLPENFRSPVPPVIIPGSIDPLHERNADMPWSDVMPTLASLGITPDRPIVVLDWGGEDPKGAVPLIESLLSSNAVENVQVVAVVREPFIQGAESVNFLRQRFENRSRLHVVRLQLWDHRRANALATAATLCVHPRPYAESGIPLLEHMWKAKPVVVGPDAGRILALEPGRSCFVASPPRETAPIVAGLLRRRETVRRMGRDAREAVRRHHLVTRVAADYLRLLRTPLERVPRDASRCRGLSAPSV